MVVNENMVMMKRGILSILGLVFILTMNLTAQQPNIILIIVDDAGYADWGFQGSTVMETPNLNDLKNEGTYFPHAYVTNSVCAPSRAGLMTGRYQNRFGFEYNIVTYHAAPDHTLADVGLDPAEKTIGDHLQALGYSTAAIGKWHLGEEDHHHPNNRGFDYFYGLLSGSRAYFHTSDLPSGKKLMRNFVVDDLTDGYMTDVLTDDAIKWMKTQVDQENPFFTYLSYTAVHGPYESKTEDFDHFSDNCIGFDGNACDSKRQNYAAMTYSLDQNIGNLIDSLKLMGVYDNTLLFFINDNGGPSPRVITDNGELRGGKSNYYEGGLRVPFFMVWPNHVPAGVTYDKQVISLDMLPTMIKAAGGSVTAELELDGVDLLPLTQNTELVAHEYLYWRKFLVWDVIQKNSQKLVVKYNNPGDADNDTLLYDLDSDIGENVNLYSKSKSALESELLQEFAKWEEELALPAWIGDEISNRQCSESATDMTECDNILIAYGKMQPLQEASSEWTGEAEDAILSGTVEVATGCSNASHDFVKMQNLGGNSIRFENVNIVEAGSYELIIDYFQAADSKLELFINDVSNGELLFPAAQWCYQGPAGQYALDIDLIQGVNSIELRVYSGISGPFLDRLRIFNPNYSHVPGTYYVSASEGNDSNDGHSSTTPFQSLEKMSATGLGPGDSVLFKSGDSFKGQLLLNGSGSVDTLIVVSSYGIGEKPLLDGSGIEGGDHLATILIKNQSHVKVENLEITNDRQVSRSGVSDNLAYGIYVHNDGYEIMSDLTFKHLKIRDIYAISLDGVEFNSIKVAAIGFKSEKNIVAGKEKHIRDVLVDSIYVEHTTRYGIHTAHGGGDEGIGNDSLNRNMNLVFRNSHYFQTGGSCITPGRSYNCLIENNIFEYPGSDYDPRMANRGSGAWFWSCQNVIAQYNRIYHVRGKGDSYGMHIDFGNTNVILQYNYSEDSEGGFVEILGKNVNSVYRFNVSVNDGFRDFHGNTLWVSDYAGTGNKINSDENYIYNNSVFVNNNITPDILITGKNTYVYNNIFVATGLAQIGQEVSVNIEAGSELKMSNNLYFGNISNAFKSHDSAPVYGDPAYDTPGGQDVESYKITEGSPAIGAGKVFPEPEFPNAGKGIFAHVGKVPKFDLYGNPVNLAKDIPSIGAFNADPVSALSNHKSGNFSSRIHVYPNPVEDLMHINLLDMMSGETEFVISDLTGRIMQKTSREMDSGDMKVSIKPDQGLMNGIYVLHVISEGRTDSKIFVLAR